MRLWPCNKLKSKSAVQEQNPNNTKQSPPAKLDVRKGYLSLGSPPEAVAVIEQRNARESSLLKLPGEIRNQIYGNVFDQMIQMEWKHLSTAARPFPSSKTRDKTFQLQTHSSIYLRAKDPVTLLSRVCRQLHRETNDLIWTKSIFKNTPAITLVEKRPLRTRLARGHIFSDPNPTYHSCSPTVPYFITLLPEVRQEQIKTVCYDRDYDFMGSTGFGHWSKCKGLREVWIINGPFRYWWDKEAVERLWAFTHPGKEIKFFWIRQGKKTYF